LLFAVIVLCILMLVCSSVYYFSYTSRQHNIKIRLTNWAITTGKLLSQTSLFDTEMVAKIDASTTLAMKNKSVQAYDGQGKRKFLYSDTPLDSGYYEPSLIQKANAGQDVYFNVGDREGVAHAFKNKDFHMVVIAEAYDEEGIKKLEQLKIILWFSFAGGILIAVAAGYFFSKQLLIPLRKIADEVNKISVHNLDDRIKTGGGKDEWNYLSLTLNKLLNRMQESFETHRRFISNASHELLTPLTAMSSQLEISLNRDREGHEYKSVMGSVYQDVQQLGRLTKTLLEFARASGDPGGLDIDLVRIDEVLLALPSELAKLNITYLVDLRFEQLPEEEEKLLVFGNETLLFTAIKNIVNNACKYSENHLANVKLFYFQNTIHISIADTGKGISDDKIEKIFQPFFRVDENNINQGFGLGLSLAKQIIELHKGRISLQSELNVGTVFTIILPSAGNLLQSK